MWKPRNKWQLQTKGGCESSGGGSSDSSIFYVTIEATFDPAQGYNITNYDKTVSEIINAVNSGKSVKALLISNDGSVLEFQLSDYTRESDAPPKMAKFKNADVSISDDNKTLYVYTTLITLVDGADAQIVEKVVDLRTSSET